MIFEETKKEPEDIFKDVEEAPAPGAAAGIPGAPRPVLREVPPGTTMPPVAPHRGGLAGILWVFLIIIVILGIGGSVFYFIYWVPSQQPVEAPAVTTPTVEEEAEEVEEPEAVPPPEIMPPEEEVVEEEVPPTVPQPPVDTDGDGLNDDEEMVLGTDPNLADTDGDGLSDREETTVWKTDPLIIDTDGDGFGDKEEIDNGYNPNGPGKLPSFPGS